MRLLILIKLHLSIVIGKDAPSFYAYKSEKVTNQAKEKENIFPLARMYDSDNIVHGALSVKTYDAFILNQ